MEEERVGRDRRELSPSFTLLRALGRNGALARIQLSFLLATMVEWAAWLSLVVIAFQRGGAAEAGVVGFAVAVPAVVVAPAAAILGDRWPRSRVLVGAYLGQAATFAGAAVAFLADAPVAGYALGIAAMSIIALIRPLLASVLPEVAGSPEELTAGNVASGLGEGGGAMVGPLVAGAVFALAGAAHVLALSAVVMIGAALLIAPVAVKARSLPLDRLLPADVGVLGGVGVLAHELAAGGAAIVADRRLTVLTGLMSVTIGILGALSVLIVIVAIDVLGLDEDAAGYLTAVGGGGALLGSMLATSLVGRERLAMPLLISVVGFAVAVGAVGFATTPVAVVVALAATGIGWSVAVVAATTLTQRLAGDDVMTRVFGVNEATQTGAEAIGGLLVPVLVVIGGPTGALVACGVVLLVVAAAAAPTLLRADRVDPAFLADVAAVRAVSILGPLSGPVIERLAAGAERLHVPGGTVVVREGEAGDRFYIVVAGGVEVTIAGRHASALGPGHAFGEIALVRDVPRTATVTALEPTALLAIGRGAFLEAVTGQPRSRSLAAAVVERHLNADAGASDGSS